MNTEGVAPAKVKSELALAKRLQAVRRERGFTQQALCQAANLSYSTLAKIERGAIKSPSIFTVQSIATALGVSLDYIMGSQATGPTARYRRTKSGIGFIYFDINDTLVVAAQPAVMQLAKQSGQLPDVIETAFWHYNARAGRGEMSMNDLNHGLGKRLGVEVDWAKLYLDNAEPIPEMVELMTWAARHYKVGLLSNTLPGLIGGLRERKVLPDLPYAAVVDSSALGVMKPDAKIFEIAEERAGVPADELLLIDDTRANLMAAEQHGWHVSWFDGYRAKDSAKRLRMTLEPA